MSDLPTFEHFQLHQLSPGVYAAIAAPGGAAYSNAGIIDLGDSTLVFDMFSTPQAAQDLRVAAQRLTGRAPAYVVISHHHSDHWCGAQAFDAATIISARQTRALIAGVAEDVRQWRADPQAMQKWVRELEQRLQTESDARWRAALKLQLAARRHIQAAPPLEPRLPHLTFDEKLVLHGALRAVELRVFENGHTPSDVYIVLPEGCAFMGDLAFFQGHPYLADGDLRGWTALLEMLEQSDVRTFVPGHGPLGTKQDLALLKQYIAALEKLADQVVQAGGSADEAARQPIPAPFDAWQDGLLRFEANMRFLHQQLTERSKP